MESIDTYATMLTRYVYVQIGYLSRHADAAFNTYLVQGWTSQLITLNSIDLLSAAVVAPLYVT